MDLFMDATNRRFCSSLANVTAGVAILNLKLVAHDTESVSIAYVVAGAISAIPDGTALYIGARAKKNALAGELLFAAVLDDNDQTTTEKRYVFDVGINQDAVDVALGTARFADCVIEAVLVDGSGLQKQSVQTDFTLYKDVIRNNDVVPAGYSGGLALRYVTDAAGHKGLGHYNIDGELLSTEWPAGVTPTEPILEA